jgi:two-component system, sensor histidine kinase YesM
VKTIEKFYRKIAEYLAKRVKPQTIQFTISVSFTIISVCSMGILGVTLYNRFVNRMEDMTIESSEQLLNQTAINLETYLRNMRRISDAMYYSVIKDKDLAVDSVDEEMNLLYEANKDNLISIACYTNDGKLCDHKDIPKIGHRPAIPFLGQLFLRKFFHRDREMVKRGKNGF